MKTLYLVPIIHTSPDMGSIAPHLKDEAVSILGMESWLKHREVVGHFWDSVARFCEALDASSLKIFQDGLVAEGQAGLQIIRQGTKSGSQNYQVIEQLINRGAILVQTECLELIKQEYHYITRIIASKSAREREAVSLKYRLAQPELLRRRDDYIARKIEGSLDEEHCGVLFIGAEHDVASRLSPGISIKQVKDLARVREYRQVIVSKIKCPERLNELAGYLASPVTIE